jgi:transcription elongation factor GreA
MSEDWGETLKERAAAGDLDGLEEAWLEALEDPGPAEAFVEALEALQGDKKREMSLALLPLVLEIYAGMERHEDALTVVRCLARYRTRDPATRRALLLHMREAYQDTDWIEGFIRASGLREMVPLDEGLERFDSFAPYKPGGGVEHQAGWGAGVVEGFNEDTWDLKIRFEDGFVRELPVTSAVESLPPLDARNLRIMLMTRPDELKALAQEDPAQAVRMALKLNPGKKLTAAKVKEVLVDKVVPSAGWSRWWNRAKKAAAQDPYLLLEGGSRPVFSLREKPVTLEEEALSRVQGASDLAEAVARVREYMASRPGKELKRLLIEAVGKHMEGEEEVGPLLDGILLMEEQGSDWSKSSKEVLLDTLGEEGAAADSRGLFEVLSSIPSEKGRNLALRSLQGAYPEDWPRLLSGAFASLPKDLLDPAADHLVKKGHGGLVLVVFKELMEAPWKAPWPIFFLSRRFGGGGFEGLDGGPTISEVALAMLRCLESSLFHAQGTRNECREVEKRYEELLMDGKRRILDRFMDEGTREELERALSMVNVMSKLPESLQSELETEIVIRHPDLKREVEVAFWDEERMYCTRKGIERKEEELRVIVDEKLPEVAEAIGRAAAFGDLSENAEWTAALEDQRLLTEKASQMEDELRSVRILEDQRLPEGRVAPGTRVTLRKEEGFEETLSILGPWDTGGMGVVSYRAPLAAPLLGKKVGDRVLIELPDSSYEVTVLAVEPIVFED